MTRGYFVLEMKGLLHAAALMSDAYLEGYGKEIIEAFLNNNEERLLDTLRAKMNEKDRTEMDRYICPEWYRITKKSEAKDYIAEYGYVISAEKLKIYNNGKLLITMDKITAKEWLYLIDHSDKVDACYFYSDEKLHSDYSNDRKIYRVFENAFANGVKASQFSFSRLHKADPVLGVDMSSTGEVGCIGDDFSEALLNSMIATGFKIPEKAVMFSSGAMKSKVDLLDASRMLFAKGYQIYATAGTAAFLNAHGVETTPVYWPDEKPGAENNVMKMIADHKFDLIVNIPKNHSKRELTNGYRIRRGAIDHNIPLITNARLASAFIEAFCELKLNDIQIKSWQEYK